MLSTLTAKAGITLFLVAVISVAVAISLRNIRKIIYPPTPRPAKWDELSVIKATTGASLECSTGLRDRRTKTVNLINVAAPTDSMAEESRKNLSRVAGNIVRIEHHGILRGEPAGDSPDIKPQPQLKSYNKYISGACTGSACANNVCATNTSSEVVEALGSPLVGIVYGKSGSCLQVEQLAAGLVKCTSGAPKEWKAIEKVAMKKKIGIWKKGR
jgi:hypothetical protein